MTLEFLPLPILAFMDGWLLTWFELTDMDAVPLILMGLLGQIWRENVSKLTLNVKRRTNILAGKNWTFCKCFCRVLGENSP